MTSKTEGVREDLVQVEFVRLPSRGWSTNCVGVVRIPIAPSGDVEDWRQLFSLADNWAPLENPERDVSVVPAKALARLKMISPERKEYISTRWEYWREVQSDRDWSRHPYADSMSTE